MEIEKILVPLNGKEYSFSVEVIRDEDETFYRVTPDQGEKVLEDVSPGYLEYDESGVLQVDERALNDQGRSVISAIWETVKQQIAVTSKD